MQRPSIVSQLHAEGFEEKELMESPNFTFNHNGINVSLLAFYLGYNAKEKIFEKEARELLQRGARVNTNCGNNLFRYLLRTGNVEMIAELLSYGALVNRDKNGICNCLEYFTTEESFKNKDINRIKTAWELLLKIPTIMLFNCTTRSGLTVLDVAFLVPEKFREMFLSPLIEAIKTNLLCSITNKHFQNQAKLEEYISTLYTLPSDSNKLDLITKRIKQPMEKWLNRQDSKDANADKDILGDVKLTVVPHDAMTGDEIKTILEAMVNQSDPYFYQCILNFKKIREYESRTCHTLKLALQKHNLALIHALCQTLIYKEPEKVCRFIFNLGSYGDLSYIPETISILYIHDLVSKYELHYLFKFYDEIEKKYKDSNEYNKKIFQKILIALTPLIHGCVVAESDNLVKDINILPNEAKAIHGSVKKIFYSKTDRKKYIAKIYSLIVGNNKVSPELAEIIRQSCATAILIFLLDKKQIEDSSFKDFTFDEIRKYVEICHIISFFDTLTNDLKQASLLLHFAGKAMYHYFQHNPSISKVNTQNLYYIFLKEYRIAQTRACKIVSLGWQLETLCLNKNKSYTKSAFNHLTQLMEKNLSTPLLPNEVQRFKDQLKDCFNTIKFKEFYIRYFYMKQAELILNLMKPHDSLLTERMNLAEWCKKEFHMAPLSISAADRAKLLSTAIDQCQYWLNQVTKSTSLSLDNGDSKQSPSANIATTNNQQLVVNNLIEFYAKSIQFHYLSEENEYFKVARECLQFLIKSNISIKDWENVLKEISDVFSLDKENKLSVFKNILTEVFLLKGKNPQVEYRIWSSLAQAHFELDHFEEAFKAVMKAIDRIMEINPPTNDELTAIARLDDLKNKCLKKLSSLSPKSALPNKSDSLTHQDSKSQEPNITERSSASVAESVNTSLPSPVNVAPDRSIQNKIVRIHFEFERAKSFFADLSFQTIPENEKTTLQNLHDTYKRSWINIQADKDFKQPTEQLSAEISKLHKNLLDFSKRRDQWSVITQSVPVNAPKNAGNKKMAGKKESGTTSSSRGMFAPSDNKPKKSKSKLSRAKHNKPGKNKSTNAANSRVEITLDRSIYNRRYLTDQERQRAVEQAREQCRPWPLMSNEPSSKTTVKLTAGHGVTPENRPNSSQSLSTSTLSSSVVPQSLFSPGLTAITPTEEHAQSKSVMDAQRQQTANTESGSLVTEPDDNKSKDPIEMPRNV